MGKLFTKNFHSRVLGVLFVFGLSTAVCMGCNGSNPDATDREPDTTPPAVTSTDPAPDSFGHAVDALITVTFSEAMDPATIDTDTFFLQNGKAALEGTVSCDGKTATFTPAADLDFLTAYTATLTTGARDSSGNTLVENYTWSFTVEVAPWTGNETPEIRFGALKGFEDKADTWVWKAIPFAKPPVGPLRWKAPRNPDPWEGTREETKFSRLCTQYFTVGTSMIGDEDCLYLNVWRPQTTERDLPVYFWIHGGGNSIGSASVGYDYNGANLANRSNVVVVTTNYRLGPMGWFTHPALRTGNAGDEEDDSGNYGTLDIIKALEWVKDNIKAFGGNPDNVTITGESAGARDVQSLLISHRAKGLFHRAMSQSGGPGSSSQAQGDARVREVILTLLVKDGTVADPDAAEAYLDGLSLEEVAAYLKSKTSREIQACFPTRFGGMISSFPNLFRDGTVLPAAGFDTFETGAYPNKVPVILGSNKEERKLFLFADPSFIGKDKLYQIVASYSSDLWKATGVDQVARNLRSHPDQPAVYAYQFLWGSGGDTGESVIPEPWGFKLGSCHTLEIPFFFGNNYINVAMQLLVFTEENRPGREALTEAMMAYLARFARTGDPNEPGSGLPEWKPWSNEQEGPKSILFDVDDNHALDIRMSTEELTEEGVYESMALEVPEPLYSEAIEYLGW